MAIAQVEDHMVSTAKASFGTTLRRVEVLPSALNLAMLKAMIATAPSVYFAFLGGRVGVGHEASCNGRFVAYVITRHVGNSQAARRGDSTTIGAYDVIERLIAELHDSNVTDIGRLQLRDVQNLFSMQLQESLKAALYAVAFELPNLPLGYQADLAGLGDFATFHADYDIPPHEAAAEHDQWLAEPPDLTDSQPDAGDTVTNLDQ